MTNGDYPKTMRCLVGNRLPNFTNEESILIKGTLDFVGLNYYTSLYADDATSYSSVFLSYTTDSHVNDTGKLENFDEFVIIFNCQVYIVT